MDDSLNTWAQGYFVDSTEYRRWTTEEKENANRHESYLVRPSPTGNAICTAVSPDAARWVAKRLNDASNADALKAENEALRKTINQHNSECVGACLANNEAGDCAAYRDRGRFCPDCPAFWAIDTARQQGKEDAE